MIKRADELIKGDVIILTSKATVINTWSFPFTLEELTKIRVKYEGSEGYNIIVVLNNFQFNIYEEDITK